MIDKILFNILRLDGNETYNLSDDDYNIFKNVIVELTKIKYNIRYCSTKKCECHPESRLEKLLKNEEITSLLQYDNISHDIKYIIDNYEPITIYDVCEI